MPPVDELMSWLFKLVVGGIMSFMWWTKREDKKLLDSHTEDIVKLKSEAVTEDKVRDIVTEVTKLTIQPMQDDVSEIKAMVRANTEVTKDLQVKLAEQEGYRKAMQELKSVK